MARALALGLLVGFPIAASPGPIFFLVLRRTLARGWRSGVFSGFGVATGDATYAALAAFGVGVVTNFLLRERRWIGLAGGLALVVIGLSTAARAGSPATTKDANDSVKRSELAGAYGSMVALTLSNPTTILSFVAIFAGVGLQIDSGWQPELGLVVGVMLGSALWWVVLTTVASLLRRRLTPKLGRGIGIVSGLILLTFGILISGGALVR